MIRCGKAGNILITAIFIAIFLFFLSVALVSTNRMDIQLSLTVEHRLKARSAARSGAHYVLHAMRTYTSWEGRVLEHQSYEMDSGARWEIRTYPRTDPLSAAPNQIVIESRGYSGPVVAAYDVVVEETSLTQKATSKRPFIFSVSGGDLKYITPDFKQRNFGAGPNTDNPRYAAAGGPVFASAPANATTPVLFRTTLPAFVPTFEEPKKGPEVAVVGVPPGEHLLRLELSSEAANWVDIEDPASQLGQGLATSEELLGLPSVALPDTGDFRYSQIAMAVVQTEEGDSLRATAWFDDSPGDGDPSSELNGPISQESLAPATYNENYTPPPTIEWYTASGDFCADEDRLYTFGYRYLFLPYQHQSGNNGLTNPKLGSRLLRWPCVLAFDATSGTWEPAWAPMTDNGTLSDPTWPDMTALAASSNTLMAFIGESSNTVGELAETVRPLGDLFGERGSLVIFKDQPYIYREKAPWPVGEGSRYELVGINDTIDPFDDLRRNFPEVTSKGLRQGALLDYTLVPPRQVYCGIEQSTVPPGVWGNELFVPIKIRHQVQPASYNLAAFALSPALYQKSTVARFDGTFWDVWPDGLRPLTDVEGSESFAATEVLVAGYAAGELVNRYSVIGISESLGGVK